MKFVTSRHTQGTDAIPIADLERLYDRTYYEGDCDGHREFQNTRGRKLPRRLDKVLELLDPRPGEWIVDVGSGRGELARHCVSRGALTIAVDPSAAALAISRDAETESDRESTIHRIRARGEALPMVSGQADAVVLSDVVEHLPPSALRQLLAECARVARPGGRLIVHTQPNRTLLRWTVPIVARFSRLWGVRVPHDLRTEMTPGAGREYHVNEQTGRGLCRALRRAGFEVTETWLEGSYPIHRMFGEWRFKPALLRAFRRTPWLRALFASQIFAVGRRRASCALSCLGPTEQPPP